MLKRLSLLPLLLLGLLAHRAWSADEAPIPVQSVWKPQELTFFYHSFRTFYSCESLEDKLEQLLKEVGATARVRVRAPDCGRGVVQTPRAEIELITPVEATPKNLAELKKDEPTRELIARVRGESEAYEEFTRPFAAQWKRVEIGGRRSSYLQGGDCELIDQVRRWVLPKIGVRVLTQDYNCPHSASLSFGPPTLSVEALLPAPKPDDPQSSAD